MNSLFAGAVSFNQPLDSWDVSSVTDMAYTFYEARSFDQDISSWDVSMVTTMARMFPAAESFNQPLDSWDVSSVTNMEWLFLDAESFNQPLNSWDVSNVNNMWSMFKDATSFNQPLDSWDVSSVADMRMMFSGTRLSTDYYDSMLMAWAALPALQPNVVFDGGNSQYCLAEDEINNVLIGNFGWTVDDDGKNCQPACGNGFLDPGEQCDDGNTLDDDFCSSSCVRQKLDCNGNWYTPLPPGTIGTPAYSVNSDSGTLLAVFDSSGNLGIRGAPSVAECTAPVDSPFIIKDSSAKDVAYIDSNGNLCLSQGDLTGGDNCDAPPDGSFVVNSPAADTVSYIDKTGNLCLEGEIVENYNP
jgi:cysteine-rich repeat protein/surface protein